MANTVVNVLRIEIIKIAFSIFWGNDFLFLCRVYK